MQHHDIFSYLDHAFGLADDDLVDSRIEEEINEYKLILVQAQDKGVLKQRVTLELRDDDT